MDGHNSHINDEFLKKCEELRIRIGILPPHSTHRLQPLDVGFFSPLSTAYTVIVNQQYTAFDGRLAIKKSLFFVYFLQAWDRAISEANIKSAFQKAGLIPFNPSIALDNVATLRQHPRTPSPAPIHDQPPQSSPLGEGGSAKLLNKVKRGKKNAGKALVKLGVYTERLEAENRLL